MDDRLGDNVFFSHPLFKLYRLGCLNYRLRLVFYTMIRCELYYIMGAYAADSIELSAFPHLSPNFPLKLQDS